MGLFKQITGLEAAEIAEKAIGGIGKAADGLLTSSEERIQANTKLTEVIQQLDNAAIEYFANELEEVTKRWEADNNVDGWLPKNIRPLTMGFVTVMLVFMTFTDGAGWITIKPDWVELWKMSFMTILAAYFGTRGWQKVAKIQAAAQKRNESAFVLAGVKPRKKDLMQLLKGD